MSGYKSTDIARFVRDHLRYLLPQLPYSYKKRDLLRMHGPLVQIIILGVSRGGWIRVYPALFVSGADLAEETIHQTVSLGAEQPRRWHFPPETPLDRTFAQEILTRLERDSPISFMAPLRDEEISHALRWFGRDGLHWSADLFLAFFNMTRGAASSRDDLARAFDLFRRHSRLATAQPLLDYEERLRDRFLALEACMDTSDCLALCRADAETHATKLGLPKIVWPPEWPQSVPPWPRQSSENWLKRLLKS